jgi:hypothetical protein
MIQRRASLRVPVARKPENGVHGGRIAFGKDRTKAEGGRKATPVQTNAPMAGGKEGYHQIRQTPPACRDPYEHTTAQHTSSVKPLAARPCLDGSSWSPPDTVGFILPGTKEMLAGVCAPQLIGPHGHGRHQRRADIPGADPRFRGAPAHAAHQRSTALAGERCSTTQNPRWCPADTDGRLGVLCMGQSSHK